MEEENVKTVLVFCAGEQAETKHSLDIDASGEIVLTCECGHFIKYPAGTTPSSIKEHLLVHKAANEGQLTVEAIEAKRAEFLKQLLEE